MCLLCIDEGLIIKHINPPHRKNNGAHAPKDEWAPGCRFALRRSRRGCRRGGLALTPACARDKVRLESLKGTVLRDDLLDVRRRGVLDLLAGDLAGQNQRQGISPRGDALGALGSDSGGTLLGGRLVSLGSLGRLGSSIGHVCFSFCYLLDINST